MPNMILVSIVVRVAIIAAALQSWLECGILAVIAVVANVQARSPAGIE